MALARQKHETGQIAKGVDQRHDLGCRSTTRSTDGLILSPPLAPAPC
jgi:hypothetical protein